MDMWRWRVLSCKVVSSLHLSDDDDLNSTDTNEHNISEDFPSIFEIKCHITYNIYILQHHEQNILLVRTSTSNPFLCAADSSLRQKSCYLAVR